MDTTVCTRKYTQSFALNTPKGVEKLLRSRAKIAALRFSGDTAASDIILDLDNAIKRAKLSPRQSQAIDLIYGLDLSHVEVATRIGVIPQAVNKFNAEACRKIARVYRGWDYGEVTIELDEEVE